MSIISHPTTDDAQEFRGHVIAITGAARGIGQATAELMARRGAAVVLLDRDAVALRGAVAALRDAGAKVHGVVAELGDAERVRAAFAEAVELLGRIDGLVINHAVHGAGSVLETTLDQWDLTLSVNLTGAFACAQEALRVMVPAGGGAIVGVSSDCAVRSCRDAAAYVATKAALNALMRSIAVDHGADGVRANIVTPGVTDTPLLRSAFAARGTLEESLRACADQSLVGRIGQVGEIAEAIGFLCGPRSSFITGAELIVDGGMTLSYGGD
ncbi:MAG TPA: SDR family oxidoreductase [Baekduia sp.]|uniref:SDR family NAD(P)-dependent oxidoreductase n=1 Tax=Baekduia sp. TaxID=2600305 RepID=UPI002D767AC8|nr:SDR family oxidoreductase [Baekduia sp.]HET6509688.1 SDR family oxidoreductase [Baekduia sp.]